MTRVEVVKLCASAMGIKLARYGEQLVVKTVDLDSLLFDDPEFYNPFEDDSQAMALVKKMGLDIARRKDCWMVRKGEFSVSSRNRSEDGISSDLNRAICECVANALKGKRM